MKLDGPEAMSLCLERISFVEFLLGNVKSSPLTFWYGEWINVGVLGTMILFYGNYIKPFYEAIQKNYAQEWYVFYLWAFLRKYNIKVCFSVNYK